MMRKLPGLKIFVFAFFLLACASKSLMAQDSSANPVKNGHLKAFGGAKQYSQWSVGIAGGGMSPVIFLGGHNQYAKNNIDFGYSAFVKYQIQHSFGIRADYLGGSLTGVNGPSSQNANFISGAGSGNSIHSKVNYALSIKGEVDVATLDFLRRQNAVRVFLTAGYGLAGVSPDAYAGKTIKSGFVPIGAGVKIKASNALAINIGYEAYYFDGSNILGTPAAGNGVLNKASYGSLGLEYTFGTKTKPAMIWVNPIAVTYDELKANDSLAKEVDGLKSRVGAVEGDVSRLKKDSDGDGVSDVFDKCPNTSAGTKVDGSGCELPKMVIVMKQDSTPQTKADKVTTVRFEFDSANLTEDSHPALDAWAEEIKSGNSPIYLEGFASSEGPSLYNLHLSERRLQSVKKYLVKRGVPKKLIHTQGFGESHPIASNATKEGREKNRRVEFIKK